MRVIRSLLTAVVCLTGLWRAIDYSDPGHPRRAATLIRKGLAAEEAGDWRAAEAALLEAARMDRMLLPAWTLANYYLRRDDTASFWKWARSAATVRYSDPTPVFQLAWRVAHDLSPLVIPETRPQYRAFLLDQFDAADLLGALHIWNTLSADGLIPYPPLDPAKGRSLSNGDFAHHPLGKAFDWRPAEHPEISITIAGELRVWLSGRQPESIEILHQVVPLSGRARYTVHAGCRSEGLPSPSGLEWELPRWPPRDGLYRLALVYRRKPGTARSERMLICKSVAIERSPE